MPTAGKYDLKTAAQVNAIGKVFKVYSELGGLHMNVL